MVNPFAGLSKANEKGDRPHLRRAMNEDDLGRLLFVARQGPLIDAMPIRRGNRKWQVVGNVRDKLERLSRERVLIYKTLILTGLRKSELAGMRVNQLLLDGSHPCIESNVSEKKKPGRQLGSASARLG